MKNSAFQDFSEEALEALDFARCQRPDGSFYGTGGVCRKGSPAEAKAKELKTKQSGMAKAEKTATAAMQAHRADPGNQAKKDAFRVATMDARNAKDARDMAKKSLDKAKKAEAKESAAPKAKAKPKAKTATAEAKASKDPVVQKRVLQTELKKVSARYEKLRGKPEAAAERKKLMDRSSEIVKAQQAVQKQIDSKTTTPKKPDTSPAANQRRANAVARARD